MDILPVANPINAIFAGAHGLSFSGRRGDYCAQICFRQILEPVDVETGKQRVL